MLAALAHRVAALPSTAFGPGQHPPADDTVTGWFRDSRTGAAAAALSAPATTAPTVARLTAAALARMAKPLLRTFTLPPHANLFIGVHGPIDFIQCSRPTS